MPGLGTSSGRWDIITAKTNNNTVGSMVRLGLTELPKRTLTPLPTVMALTNDVPASPAGISSPIPDALANVVAKQHGVATPSALPAPTSSSSGYVNRLDARSLGRPGTKQPILGSADLLGSVALSISHSPLDQKWKHVSEAALGKGAWDGLVDSLSGKSMRDKLVAVNQWVNHRVAFQSETVDTWSTASETLTSGHGDCEDYAIAKLQLLRKLGVSDRDMLLVVAFDQVERQDHALLAVRIEGRMVVLDSRTDDLLDGTASMGYRPIMAFSTGHEWLYGMRQSVAGMAGAGGSTPAKL